METTKKIQVVRDLVSQVKGQNKKIGLVPTMGALHAGHLSLIDKAVEQCDYVVVSIFVNPTQFGPGEDLEKYPRPIEDDLQICSRHNVDLVFNPAPEEMYTGEHLTWVTVEKITAPLCGQSRPGHFRGVTTVCTKLFNIVTPDIAYFGQKDAQQAVVIKKMVTDLNMPLEIIVCPIIREKDGLALSSRNQYLDPQQRKDAAYIYKSLQKCEQLVKSGTIDANEILEQMRKVINTPGTVDIEYISIVDTQTLQEIEKISSESLVAVAAKIGNTRLIDNIIIDSSVD